MVRLFDAGAKDLKTEEAAHYFLPFTLATRHNTYFAAIHQPIVESKVN